MDFEYVLVMIHEYNYKSGKNNDHMSPSLQYVFGIAQRIYIYI